ncbi:3'-5' exonuclease [Nonomuraea sediminis]|uniref:3'-5' exonuclease n=1 Tax=Nonomuraea sediminis TaxID=2835864 RepID=UPI001BDD669C|nr:3'-5' exonuclease [Nonomuraea sediminis]
MAKLGIYRDFLRTFVKLEKQVQDRVAEVFSKFEGATYASLHLEPVKNAKDHQMHTIRINDFWRGVVLAPAKGDTYVLLNVLPHDKAYEWAKRHRATVNTVTATIELRDVVTLETTSTPASSAGAGGGAPLFAHVNDADMARLGVDAQVLAWARTLTAEDQLTTAGFLPKAQHDVLTGLAAGLTPDQVWAELPIGAESFDTEDVAAAVERSAGQILLVRGPDELMRAFTQPFALWRVYLHPSQRAVAYGSFSGSARVTGGPGTGKTVVALHRAKHLAEQGDGPILLTTFIRTLPAILQTALGSLIEDGEVRERIQVRHIDAVAHRLVTGGSGRLAILGQDEEKERWARIVRTLGLPARFNETFLAQEWRQVVLTQGIETLEGFQSARRHGRGRALGALQKAQVWAAISDFLTDLRNDGVWTYETVCVEATRLLHERGLRPYRHVIVDEAQDLSPWQWRLLRAAVEPARDDLFLAGDTHQRIYDNRVSLRSVGIEVAGRSSRLRINYRTTAEILRWSLSLLRGEQIDDMNESLESLAGYRSDIHGPEPLLISASVPQRELDSLVQSVREWIDQGIPPGQIGVAARSNHYADQALAWLKAAGIPAASLARKNTDSEVGVGTMHRMKGLEFRCVVVIGLNEHAVPPPSAVTPAADDEASHDHDVQRERCLLFVACTRAREQLTISWHGTPSTFLSDT